MEKIFIPRVSVLTTDKSLFSDLVKFCNVTGYVSNSDPTTREHKKPAEKAHAFSRMIRCLRTLLPQNKSEGYQYLSEDEHYDSLLSEETKKELRKKKKILLERIYKHERAVLQLADARMRAWKTERKMKEYDLVVETQKTSLKFAKKDVDARKRALKEMDMVLESWIIEHEQDHIQFEKAFLREIKHRELVLRLGTSLREEMLTAIERSIRKLMLDSKECISDSVISHLSVELFEKTSRSYTFHHVENLACQKVFVKKPIYEGSVINKNDIRKMCV